MDEHIVLERGRSVTFRGAFSDWNLHDLTFFTDKHNRYATREAIEVMRRRLGLTDGPANAESSLRGQTARKRWIKHGIYSVIPFFLSAPLYFVYRYILLGGVLDGREGLIYHFLQGLWYRFLVGAKVAELERQVRDIRLPSAAYSEILQLTGYARSSQQFGGAKSVHE
jgi:hypothetical protein